MIDSIDLCEEGEMVGQVWWQGKEVKEERAERGEDRKLIFTYHFYKIPREAKKCSHRLHLRTVKEMSK